MPWLIPQASYEGQTNVADILFGVPSREIGFRHSRNPERVITYAATLALKHYNEEWVPVWTKGHMGIRIRGEFEGLQ